MNHAINTTDFTDHQLFECDNRSRLENPDFWPPVSAAVPGRTQVAFWVDGNGTTYERRPKGIKAERLIIRESEYYTTIAACTPLFKGCVTMDQKQGVTRVLYQTIWDYKYQEMVDGITEIDTIESSVQFDPETSTYRRTMRCYTEHEEIRAYGEGQLGEGLYQSNMTGMQRMIAEDCYNGSGRVQRKSDAIPQKPKHQRAEWVAARLKVTGCTDLRDADDLIKAWATIGATPKMIDEFIAGAISKLTKFDEFLAYFVKLAAELAAVEAEPEFQVVAPYATYYCEIDEQGHPVLDGGKRIEYFDEHEADMVCTMIAPDQVYEPGFMVPYDSAMLVSGFDEANPAQHSKNLARLFEVDPDADDERIEEDDRTYASSAEFAYVTINNDLGEDHWMDRQPEWLKKAIRVIRNTRTEQGLATIAKFAWNDERVIGAAPQVRQVFWGWYKAQRTELRRQAALNTVQRSKTNLIMQRIEQADRKTIAKAGQWLFNASKGLTKLPGFNPTKLEWSQIWAAYQQRKAALTSTPPQL